jgi:hypothetical protein
MTELINEITKAEPATSQAYLRLELARDGFLAFKSSTGEVYFS